MKLTEAQIAAHEKNYCAAVERYELAAQKFRSAEKSLAVARAGLTHAEREREQEWRNLSKPFAALQQQEGRELLVKRAGRHPSSSATSDKGSTFHG